MAKARALPRGSEEATGSLGCPVSLAVVAIAALIALLPEQRLAEPLRRAALFNGELGGLLGSSFFHHGARHAINDIGSVLLMGLIYERRIGRAYVATLLLTLPLIPPLVLLLEPNLVSYCGLSGTVHALFAVALGWEWRRASWRPGWGVVLLTVVLGIKLVHEALTGELLISLEMPRRVQLAPMAHALGATFGLIASLLAREATRPRNWPRSVRGL